MTSIVGFDLSLSAPAAVVIPVGWKPGTWRRLGAHLLKPPPPSGLGGDALLSAQCRRYLDIADWAAGIVEDADVVFVEQYAFARNNAQASKLMELGGVVRARLYERGGWTMHTVSTASARKLLLGKVPKDHQKIAVQKALFGAGAPRNWEENICDAFVVANFGLTEVGRTALSLADR